MNTIKTLAAVAVAVAATGVALAAATYPAFDGTYNSTATGFVTNYAAISVVPEDHRFLDPDSGTPVAGARYYYGKIKWTATPDLWAHSVGIGVCTGAPVEEATSVFGLRFVSGNGIDYWRFWCPGTWANLTWLPRSTNFHYIIKIEDRAWNTSYTTLFIDKQNQLVEPATNGVDVIGQITWGFTAPNPIESFFVLNKRHYGSDGTELVISDTASSLTWPGVPEPALCMVSVGLVALARCRR